MAVYQQSSQENVIYNINISNCNIETLVIGDGNTVNTSSCRRRLDYPVQRTDSSSGTATQGTVNHDGEWTGTKRKQTKIRFPQRKHRANPKFSFRTSSSDSEEDTSYGTEVLRTISGERDRGFEISMKKFHSVLNNLHLLRDSGNFREFNSVADRVLLANKGDDELKILILIEKSVVVSYQNNLEKAEMMVQEALDTLSKSKVKEMLYFLVSMANLHLASFYRRQNKHGNAHSKITIADQNSQRVNSRFLTALIFYEKASNWTKYISSVSLDRSLRRKLVEQSKDQMQQCITLCTELDDGSIYIKKHHFGLLKLALLDLNCRTRAARKELTSSQSITDAKTCLEKFQGNHQNEMSEGQKIQFFVAKSDLNYRLGDLKAAQRDASQALSLAENHGFSAAIPAIKERQEDIDKQITSEETMDFVPSHENARHDTLSSATLSSQRNSSCSSGCEME